MEQTEEEILFIESEKPEFRRKPIPSLDAVIVEFLKKYEVYVQPVSSGTRNTAENAVSGAITGMFGADVGGDAFMISGQNKQTKVQEWTQWKQWALDHKDFEAFRVEQIDKAREHNENLPSKLKDPIIQKQLEPLIEQFRERGSIQSENFSIGGLIFMAILLFGIPIWFVYTEENQESSLNNEQSNIEYYQEGIPFNEEFLDSEEFLEKF